MALPGRIILSCFPAPFLSLLLLLLLLPPLTIAKFRNGPSSVSAPTVWMPSEPYDFNLTYFVLSRLNSGPSFLCGFWCNSGGCYFGLFIFQPTQDIENIIPRPVWFIDSAGQMQLTLTQEGGLFLLGDDGKKMWSTNTSGKPIVGLNLTEGGNLVLYDRNDAIIWQFFDHLADIILPGQELRPGMKLTSTSGQQDGTARVYTFTTDDQIGFVGSVRVANSSQIYYETGYVSKMKSDNGQVGALYKNATFGEFEFSPTSLPQFIRLELDGHLNLYVYDEHSTDWMQTDLLKDRVDACTYPFACGSYGICSSASHGYDCLCPNETQQIDARVSSYGCTRTSPFSCDSRDNTFAEVEKITFFALSYNNISANISNTIVESCKEECLKKGCSCTIALFQNQANFFGGDYYLLLDSFSLVDKQSIEYSTLAFIKVNCSSNTLMPSSNFQRKKRG